jgi:hypothetical protein
MFCRYFKDSELKALSKEQNRQMVKEMPLLIKEWSDDIKTLLEVVDKEEDGDLNLDRLQYFQDKVDQFLIDGNITAARCRQMINFYKHFFTGDYYKPYLPNRKFRGSSGMCGTGQDEYYDFE